MTLLTLGPSTLIAQQTEPPICKTTTGKHFATADQVRKCLKDARTAESYDAAVAAVDRATAKANGETRRADQLEQDRKAERTISDQRLIQLTEVKEENKGLRKRPKTWQLALVSAAAFVAGTAVGFAAEKFK